MNAHPPADTSILRASLCPCEPRPLMPAPRVETQVQIFVPHDVDAGMWECLRSRFRIAQRGIVERLSANPQQITMVVRAILLERKELSAICVANQRREAVRSNVSTDV